ncbi:15117_t:CDS:2 [Funneliformis caledonium]|uniref:15117_t:CDS:1 n=1 Tax=Funneliformis caledonium TaxID=1117310 RepID=A0A9N9CUU7_9GLOM|nr:15117_t:CDS:2 [Funneliformis caledonium]
MLDVIIETPQMGKMGRRPNGFIIFHFELWKEYKKAFPNAKPRKFSVFAGELWKKLSVAEKNKYIMLSEEKKRKECNSKNDLQKKK